MSRRQRASSLEHELDIAVRLACAAGQALRKYRAGSVEVRYKARGEPVTPADIQADVIIRNGLQAAFPDDAIYSEESPDSSERLMNARVWIVDPLDSTSNFVENGDEYCVSIGLALEGAPVLGVVYNPSRDQLFAGGEGLGVTLNGAPAQISRCDTLLAAHITVSRKEWRRGLAGLADGPPLLPMASMAHKLARVAAGLDDGVVSAKSRKEWGTCAGVALVRASGGRVTLLDGREISFNRRQLTQGVGMVAGGPSLHPLLLSALAATPRTTLPER
jgi:myo-inositol-1(or 4)-monophosphatase